MAADRESLFDAFRCRIGWHAWKDVPCFILGQRHESHMSGMRACLRCKRVVQRLDHFDPFVTLHAYGKATLDREWMEQHGLV